MKRIFNTLAIVLMAALAVTSCSDDENNAGDPREYAITAKCDVEAVDTTFQNLVPSIVDRAMQSAGINAQNPYLYITARDSADAAPQLQSIAAKMESVLGEASFQLTGHIDLFATEKQNLHLSTKDQQWNLWSLTRLAEAENGTKPKLTWETTAQLYVYDMNVYSVDGSSKPREIHYNDNNGKLTRVQHWDRMDLNEYARGNYIYMMFMGTTMPNSSTYRDKLVTDVVMINTGRDGNRPMFVDIEEGGVTRRYYPAEPHADSPEKVPDLNYNAGGPYLWLYYTTDARDGYILANRTNEANKPTLYTKVVNTSNMNERPDYKYMHSYQLNSAGKWEDKGKADMNEGVGGSFIYLMKAYAKVK